MVYNKIQHDIFDAIHAATLQLPLLAVDASQNELNNPAETKIQLKVKN